MRDIEAAYKDALIEEHAGYVRAGRTEDAEHVAATLKDRYDHDVTNEGIEAPAPEPKKAEAEKADAGKAPEAAVDPKPRRTPRVKPASGKADGE